MCLDRLDDFKPCEVGYKVFSYLDKQLYGDHINIARARPVGKWLNAEDFGNSRRKYVRKSTNTKFYPCGWHVFHTRRAAREWMNNEYGYVVRKVLCKEPVATGIQLGLKVTVCKKIFIIGGKK